VKDLTIVGDDMSRWRFKLCNFDNDMEGGKNLNDDLNVRKLLQVAKRFVTCTRS